MNIIESQVNKVITEKQLFCCTEVKNEKLDVPPLPIKSSTLLQLIELAETVGKKIAQQLTKKLNLI